MRIRGRQLSGNTILATKIESVSSGGTVEVELQGTIQAMNPNSSVTIRGVLVDATGITEFEVDDQSVSAATFFSRLGIGDHVEAGGVRTASTVNWDEAELE